MSKTSNDHQMSLEEYQQKYTNPENIKAARSFLTILALAIAIIIITCLFFVVLRLFEIHEYAGYAGGVAAIVFFVFAYIIPLVKLSKTKSFMTNITTSSARKAQRYNRKLREEIADKMIDATLKIEGVGWYSDAHIAKLAVARQRRKDEDLKHILADIYQKDVKEASNKMIRKSAVKVGITTAISQNQVVDTLLVFTYQLNLIKDIVYLYGYRPSESQMVKIYRNVIASALLAYGTSTATSGFSKSVGSGIVTAIDKASQSRSVITSTLGSMAGGLVGTAIDSGIQFAVNSTLMTLIGNQTKKYLIREYRLQELLDNVNISVSEEEEAKLLETVKKEVTFNVFKKQKKIKEEPTPA